MRFVLLLLTTLLFLTARDNPFEQVVTKEAFPVSTNEPKILDPFKLTQFQLPSSARSIERITIVYKNLDASLDSVTNELDQAVDWHMPITVSHEHHAPVNKTQTKEAADLKFIRFTTQGNDIVVSTKNRLLRDFMLANPHRIVLDFERDSRFLSKKISNLSKPFTQIRLGNHKGFYRVVVELDGQYIYKIKPSQNSYVISVK